MKNLIRPVLLLAIMSHPLTAQQPKPSIALCMQIAGSQQRLACFDQLAVNQQTIKPNTDSPVIESSPTKALPATKVLVKKPAPAVEKILAQPSHVPIVSAQPTATAKNVEPEPVLAVEEFGFEGKIAAKRQIDKLSAKVTAVRQNLYKAKIVTLDNGQVWQQTDTVRIRIRPGDTIYVKRGALGSFFIGTFDGNKRIRVKRKQ
jgi:hypothetical protein